MIGDSNSSLQKKASVAKTVFWIGVVGDGLIAVEWMAISLGKENFPVLPSFFIGSGLDFRFAMSICGIFMFAWTFLLYWGSRKPLERRDLLIITSGFLLIALILEWIGFFSYFEGLLSGKQLLFGAVLKFYLVIQFGVAYWYSRT